MTRRSTAPTRPCPICGRSNGFAVWHEDGYAYRVCPSCTVMYADIGYEQYLDTRHNKWDEETVEATTAGFYGSARYRPYCDFLAAVPPTGGRRLLDVGCGMGYFVEQACRSGWEGTGLDTSEHWIAEAARRVGPQRVVHGDAFSADLGGQRFDLITVWDVLEHIWDPVPFVARLRELLTPEGRLFVRTPNVTYCGPLYMFRQGVLRQRHATLGPTNHVVYFTSHGMRRLLATARLAPTSWRGFPPPQTAITGDDDSRVPANGHWTIRAKNLYGWVTGGLAEVSRGHVSLASDLDVLAAALPPASPSQP